MKLRFAICALAAVMASPLSAETLSNRSIVALSASGIGDEAIIAKIRSSDSKFDLSTDQMITLKKQGVSGPVIAVMIAASEQKKPNAGSAAQGRSTVPSTAGPPPSAGKADLASARPPGIYLLSEGRLVRIDFNSSGQTKTGGLLGTMLTSGIAATSINAVIQGETARTKTSDSSPIFYFYLAGSDGTARNANGFDTQSTTPASPNEFSLIRLASKKGQRQARVGRANIGGVKSGVMEKDRVAFDYDEVRPGIFSVHPIAPMAPGEYAFIMIGGGDAKLAKIFDFSIH